MAGSGKSTLSEWICKKLARHYQESGTEFCKENVEPYFLRSSTLDALGKVRNELGSGIPILLDDWTPRKLRGAAAIEADELKNILDVTMAKQLPARWEELLLPKMAPRIITSNAESPSQWSHFLPKKLHEWVAVLVSSDGSSGLSEEKKEVLALMKQQMTNDATAIVRRAVFVHINHSLIPVDKKRKPEDAANAEVSRKMQRLLEEDE